MNLLIQPGHPLPVAVGQLDEGAGSSVRSVRRGGQGLSPIIALVSREGCRLPDAVIQASRAGDTTGCGSARLAMTRPCWDDINRTHPQERFRKDISWISVCEASK